MTIFAIRHVFEIATSRKGKLHSRGRREAHGLEV